MTIVYILTALFVFGLLVAVHELGHFLAAKACGVRVNEFSIGMGPAIWTKEKGETLYALRALPVGGYCAMEGEDEDTGDERAFTRQSGWKKFVILVAGAGMNFLTGVVILLALYAGTQTVYTDQIAGFAPEFSQQGEAGLMEGDLIYKIDGYRTYLAGDAQMFLSYGGDTVDIEVIRDGEHILVEDVPRTTYTGTDGQPYTGYGLLVGSSGREATLGVKLQYAWYNAVDYVQLAWFSLVQLVTGNAGMQDLSGPVGIVSIMTETSEAASQYGVLVVVRSLANFAALLAVNLAVMNLLPIPALDGGRIFLLLVDAVGMLLFRKKVPEKYQAAVNTAGFVVLMGFVLIVTVFDVFRLF